MYFQEKNQIHKFLFKQLQKAMVKHLQVAFQKSVEGQLFDHSMGIGIATQMTVTAKL